MPAKKVIKVDRANVNCGLYDGEWQACFDCVGEERCKRALFYTDPPQADDEGVKKQRGGCFHPVMCRAALEALRDRITEELKQFEVEDV